MQPCLKVFVSPVPPTVRVSGEPSLFHLLFVVICYMYLIHTFVFLAQKEAVLKSAGSFQSMSSKRKSTSCELGAA